MTHPAEKDAHTDCRKATARAWSAFLESALDDRLEDGTPALALTFALNPDLKKRLMDALAPRPISPEGTQR